jgi:hypothetical protein
MAFCGFSLAEQRASNQGIWPDTAFCRPHTPDPIKSGIGLAAFPLVNRSLQSITAVMILSSHEVWSSSLSSFFNAPTTVRMYFSACAQQFAFICSAKNKRSKTPFLAQRLTRLYYGIPLSESFR